MRSENPIFGGGITRSRWFPAIIGLSLVWCLCVCFGVNTLSSWSLQSSRDEEAIGEVINDYMTTMEKRDFRYAALYFVTPITEADKENRLAILEQWVAEDYVAFEGYEYSEVERIRSQGEDENGARRVEATGTVEYDGGFTGGFEAILVEELATLQWKIEDIVIMVPPKKP